MPTYTVYGLTVASSRPIEGLARATGHPPNVDVEIRYGPLPEWLRTPEASTPLSTGWEADSAGEPLLEIRRAIESDDLWLRYTDGTEFLIAHSGRSVLADWGPGLSFEDMVVYFLGPVLGILRRLRGENSLHASVVAVDDRAVAFVGPSGSGKSTNAAIFSLAGHKALSDDLLALSECEGVFLAEPGYSWLRLWPESVQGLFESPQALPLIVDGWEKRYLDLAAKNSFCSAARPLEAIYLLGDRKTAGIPVIRPITGHAALTALIANTYAGYLPLDETRQAEFERLSRVVSTVPVRELVVADDWDSTSSVVGTVAADLGVPADAEVI